MRTSVITVVFGLSLTVAIPAQTPLTTARVATGLSRPLWVGSPPRDYDRLFVLEQSTGLIKIIKNGRVLPAPFLNARSRIVTGGERGLLGLAFHPKYASNGWLFVNYTRLADGATVVERFTASATNPDVVDPRSGRVILTIAQPFANHNGGCLHFGPDGYLYIATGDGGSGGDPGCRAQSGRSLLGKMLRIDVDRGLPYTVPRSNPFVGNGNVRDEIWSLGLRNPWRFSFDRGTGDVYIGDVGQGAKEEITFEASGKGGINHGWKAMEGLNCFNTRGCAANVPSCNDPRLTKPLHDYGRTAGRSVTGGHVYRGCAVPDLAGTYFFADYATRRVWSFRYDGRRLTDFRDRTAELAPVGARFGRISSFGEDARGEVYITDFDGQVHKIVPRASAPAVDLGFGKVGGNGKAPKFEVCGLLTRGQHAWALLRDAPARSAAVLLAATTNRPLRVFGGTIVPSDAQLALLIATDANGEASAAIPGGFGPATLFAQLVMTDPGASFGLGISNALRITWR